MKTTPTPTPPNLIKRPAADRGQANHGWLHARFTFSFAEYFDPEHMGFRALRVMNNDTIQPGGGFPMHPHKEMEIFTYIIKGNLEHRDSMGNGSVIEPGDLQYMSAGNGIRHSEFNPSATDETELYQIWLRPNEKGGEPRYAEIALGEKAEPELPLAPFSGDGRDGSTAIRQAAEIYFGKLKKGNKIAAPGSEVTPHAWIQVIHGDLSVMGSTLQTGDGLAVESKPGQFDIVADAESEFLLFRLS